MRLIRLLFALWLLLTLSAGLALIRGELLFLPAFIALLGMALLLFPACRSYVRAYRGLDENEEEEAP